MCWRGLKQRKYGKKYVFYVVMGMGMALFMNAMSYRELDTVNNVRESTKRALKVKKTRKNWIFKWIQARFQKNGWNCEGIRGFRGTVRFI